MTLCTSATGKGRALSFVSTIAAPFQNKRILRNISVLTLALAGAQAAYATDWYVDGKYGSDSNAGTSKSTALKTINRAWSRSQPGDTVRVLPTITYGPVWLGNRSGYAGKPITLRGEGDASNMTKISGQYSKGGIMLEKGRSYITIANFDVTAPGHGTYAGHSGIHLLGNHHINILNNYVHDSGCSGIQTTHSDYLTISNNRVAHNAKDNWNNIYCSGISTHENLDVDSNTGTKILISNNAIWGNTNTKSPSCKSPCTNSDGSGIIIDDSRRTQTDYKKYRGRHVVQNNVISNNGGRAVHVYISDNVWIFNNTMYNNNRDTNGGSWRPGEVSIIKSGGISVYNNIMHTDGGYVNQYSGERVSISIQNNDGSPVVVDNNLLYNTKNSLAHRSFVRNNYTTVTVGAANRFGSPGFKNAGNDLSWADFRLGSTSSLAFGFNSPSWTVPATDFLNATRWTPVTAGAYQNAF